MDIHEAKTHLPRNVERAVEVQEIIVAGEPIVRRPGRFAGSLKVTSALFEPLAEEDLSAWES